MDIDLALAGHMHMWELLTFADQAHRRNASFGTGARRSTAKVAPANSPA
jgi:hypothetical protein